MPTASPAHLPSLPTFLQIPRQPHSHGHLCSRLLSLMCLLSLLSNFPKGQTYLYKQFPINQSIDQAYTQNLDGCNSMNFKFRESGQERQKRVLHHNFYSSLFLKSLLVVSLWAVSRPTPMKLAAFLLSGFIFLSTPYFISASSSWNFKFLSLSYTKPFSSSNLSQQNPASGYPHSPNPTNSSVETCKLHPP